MMKAQSLDGLFEKLLDGQSIFKNKEVLRPSYTPDLLLTEMSKSATLPQSLFLLSEERLLLMC